MLFKNLKGMAANPDSHFLRLYCTLALQCSIQAIAQALVVCDMGADLGAMLHFGFVGDGVILAGALAG